MAFITYPLNMVDYTAEDAELFHCTRNSGIYADDDFQCVASGVDNTITVGEGIGWIRNSKYSGKVFANKTAEVVDLGLADANLPRYDVIAIQFNKAQNLTKIVVKNGTPANSPKIPERSVTESIYELYLCKVYRPAGAVTITANNLTDTRLDAELCGLMGDSVTSVDTSAIDAQVRPLIENLKAEIQGVKDTSGFMFESDWVKNGVIPVNKGGTGATTADEALNNLGAIAKGNVHNINIYEKFNSTTSLSDTGIRVTIPANSFFSISATAVWGNDKPLACCIQSPKPYQGLTDNGVGNSGATTAFSGFTTEEINISILAKYDGASQNTMRVNGFYVTL